MKKLILLFLAVVLTFAFSVNAVAVKQEIDTSKTGTLTVTMECSHGYRSGGTVELYYVATVDLRNNEYAFDYTEAFKDCPLSTDNISDGLEADKFYAYLTDAGIEGERAALTDGVAVYSNLPTGLYLVVQAETDSGFSKALTFFVTIPVADGDNWNYNVDASPKVEIEHTDIPTPPGIPETGQLKWPVPVMALSGLLLTAIGFIILKRNKSR